MNKVNIHSTGIYIFTNTSSLSERAGFGAGTPGNATGGFPENITGAFGRSSAGTRPIPGWGM